jgi:outer membrane protein OmpA-like peptidoglycan-associated protein
VVTGFTDSQGNEAFNEKLSEFRANTVKSYMVGKGLKESQIISRGLGSQYPIASNDTYAGRMANRRVEIEIESKN